MKTALFLVFFILFYCIYLYAQKKENILRRLLQPKLKKTDDAEKQKRILLRYPYKPFLPYFWLFVSLVFFSFTVYSLRQIASANLPRFFFYGLLLLNGFFSIAIQALFHKPYDAQLFVSQFIVPALFMFFGAFFAPFLWIFHNIAKAVSYVVLPCLVAEFVWKYRDDPDAEAISEELLEAKKIIEKGGSL